jgi:hypothetical protein
MATKSTTPTAPAPPDRAINITIPGPIHQALKIAAARRSITVKDAVLEALEDWSNHQH